jgi:hypothetical protein
MKTRPKAETAANGLLMAAWMATSPFVAYVEMEPEQT